MRAAPALAILMAGFLAGCSGKPPQTTYVSPSTGETTVIESNKEMCAKSCNQDYDRCMETSPAQQNIPGVQSEGHGFAPGMIGASADCRRDLQDCLPRCKGR